MNRKTDAVVDKKQAGRKGGFPVLPLIMLLLAFIVLIYSAFSVYVFAHTLHSAAESEEGADTVALEDGTVIERGNLKFTTEELFNLSDASGTSGTVLLFVFCTLAFGSLVVIVFSYRAIARSKTSRTLKIILVVAGTLVSILAALFVTYQLAQAQLDWFKNEKDDTPIERNETHVDPNGNFYLVDGNGVPYLSLELDDPDLTDDLRSELSDHLGIADVETLYVFCDFSVNDDKSITIDRFRIEDDEGSKKEIDLECLSSAEAETVYYKLKFDGNSARYKVLSGSSNSDVRIDPDAKTTFLIVGKDRVGSNTDVMMLVSLHEENGRPAAEILQIPRDTYCRDNSSNNKINAVYGTFRNASGAETETEKIFAGMNGLKSVLERNLLIKIDYWAIMNLDGFGSIVDTIGGVDMYVPFDMNYDDPTAVPELHIHLKQGQQNLNGKQAEQFIRFRKGYVTGDLGRVDATKIFLTAFFCKLRSELSLSNPSALTSTISTLMDYVTTDMDTGNAVAFVKMVLNLYLEDITFVNLPGSDYAKAPDSALSYYTSNRKGMYYVINKYFNVYDTDINEKEFDSSRMFTTQSKNTELDRAHNASFDAEAFEKTLKGADEIQEEQNNRENNLPVVNGLRN